MSRMGTITWKDYVGKGVGPEPCVVVVLSRTYFHVDRNRWTLKYHYSPPTDVTGALPSLDGTKRVYVRGLVYNRDNYPVWVHGTGRSDLRFWTRGPGSSPTSKSPRPMTAPLSTDRSITVKREKFEIRKDN